MWFVEDEKKLDNNAERFGFMIFHVKALIPKHTQKKARRGPKHGSQDLPVLGSNTLSRTFSKTPRRDTSMTKEGIN
jgi:hypothetical protein